MSRHRSTAPPRPTRLAAFVAVGTAAILVVLLAASNWTGDGAAPAARSGFGATATPSATATPTPAGRGSLGEPEVPPEDREEESTGWPGSHNTGVPAGVRLTEYDGPLVITEAGAVIDGRIIRGCLEIAAPDVLIRRSRLECDSMMVEVATWADASASVTIEDSEMDGQGTAAVIQDGNYTLRRVNIHNINEGPRIGDNVVIEDSWLHDLVFRSWEDHQDLLQTVGGTGAVIRGNTLDARSDPVYFTNAVFQVGAEFGPTRDFLFEDNFVDGGGYAINVRDDPGMENIVFRRNAFGRHAEYGPVTLGEGSGVPGVRWESSNVYADTGEPVL